MAITGYVSHISDNEIVDNEARNKIKQLQEQVQALRICVLALVRGLIELDNGSLIVTGGSTYERDIARSAWQLASPNNGYHSSQDCTTLQSLMNLSRGKYYFSNSNYDSKGLNEIIKNYWENFSDSSDTASGKINTVTSKKNIF